MIVGAYVDRMAPDHPAGAEWTIHDAFSWLARKGHDCRIVSRLDYTQTIIEPGLLLWGHPTDAELAAHYHECDVMVTQLDATIHAQLLAATYQTPLVVYVHSAAQAETIVESACALLVANSDHVAEACFADLVLHPPIDADRVRVEPGLCTTLVNLSNSKGGGVLWRLAQEHERTPFLGVQGAYDTQQLTPQGLARLSATETADSGLPPNLSVIGPQRDIREALRYTRQLLVLSHTETYGRIAAEAAVSGIPTIASDTPGLRECLGDAAVYVERDQMVPLARAIAAGYTDAWEAASIAASERWQGTLSPRQELELRAFERELKIIANDQPRMTL